MTATAIDLSGHLAAVVERCGPSVVRVNGRRAAESSGVVWSSDGVIATASHALEWDEGLTVMLSEGRAVAATLIGRDPTTDVAALRVAASGLQAPTWAALTAAKVGHLVLALSRPGRSARASLGIVSAAGEAWRTPAGGRIDRYIQADVSLHVGFSGGLVVDAAGEGIGMSSSGLLRRTALVVPAETLRRVIDALLAHGHVRRGFVGIGTYPVRFPASLEQQLGQASGLLLISVEPDGPAGRAGLLLGDILVSLDGRRVTQAEELLPFLEEEHIGKDVLARVVRAGEVRELSLVLGARDLRASS